ncbi:hypothetical protein ACFPVT_02635 [Corynebacterium choanae]|uniref:Uncharacterized protein n=1 Tax=Corynebacterium choanae TaxID=1862358 RepID=A0A3G6JAJ0_9CORY|nr:hypothetical protein [Corynebacterium choanae]AZA12974.1 hypothetical protein CCHOA_02790 [Corynebacterium choanae]
MKAACELKLAHVLRAYGITDENADLFGDDPERFEERAEKIAVLQAAHTEQEGGKPPREIPVADMKPGASPSRQAGSPYDVLPGWQPSRPIGCKVQHKQVTI